MQMLFFNPVKPLCRRLAVRAVGAAVVLTLVSVQQVSAQDLTPPELQAVSVSPTSINVTSGPQDVVFTVRVTDDLSGFVSGSLRIRNSTGSLTKTAFIGAANRVSGDNLDGIYESVVTFPQFSEAGDWKVFSASFTDTTTNIRTYLFPELGTLGFDATVSVISDEDTTVADVTSLSFSPQAVDVSSASDNVQITIAVSDDLSGVGRGWVQVFSPTNIQSRAAFFNQAHLIAGDALNGTYRVTLSMPRYAQAGDWAVWVYLEDKATNRVNYTPDDLTTRGLPNTLAVSSDPQDILAPELVEFSAAPTVVNTILDDDIATFSGRLTDNLSGFYFTQFRISSPSGRQNQWVFFNSAGRLSGTEIDGTYKSDKLFPRYSEYGEWTVNFMNLRDLTGNTRFLTDADLENLGLSLTILMEGLVVGGGGVFPIPKEGGSLETQDGDLTMDFPPDALDEDTVITITEVGRFDPVDIFIGPNQNPAQGTVLAEYDFMPDGLQFGEPVTVVVTVDVTDLSQSRRDRLDIYQFEDTDGDGVLDTFVPIPDEQIISIVTTEPDADGREYMVFTFLLEHFSVYAVVEEIVDLDDTVPPDVVVIVPAADASVQDTVTLVAVATDDSGVAAVNFTVREVTTDDGIIGQELLAATRRDGTDEWELDLDTTELLDGCYTVSAAARDAIGNEKTSDVVQFTIRNWSMMDMLPMANSYRAGRTMPVKFSLEVDEAVDPSTPFVHNEELAVWIYETVNPAEILQLSLYGDASEDYRINADDEQYITNFKTLRDPAAYTVEIRRLSNDFLIAAFEFETTN